MRVGHEYLYAEANVAALAGLLARRWGPKGKRTLLERSQVVADCDARGAIVVALAAVAAWDKLAEDAAAQELLG